MKFKGKGWETTLGAFLIILTILLYLLHYLIFHDIHHIMIYFLGDLAFLPLEVLLVVLILHRVIEKRERRIKLDKLGVVINTFFSEVGNNLLKQLILFDEEPEALRKELDNIAGFNKKDFSILLRKIKEYNYRVKAQKGDLEGMKKFLLDKRDFILMLLENPMLLEHDRFTNLLWATLHLQEELFHRKNLKGLSPKDYEHLGGDIKRVYAFLLEEYVIHLMNLKEKYPYLFSLTARMNPLKEEAKAEIT